MQTVLALMHGGGVATPDEAGGARISAIIDAFYGGVSGPQAIADIIFGAVVPSGRMPITIYDPTEPMQPLSDYDMTAGYAFSFSVCCQRLRPVFIYLPTRTAGRRVA